MTSLMHRDARGLGVTSDSTEAVRLLDAAVQAMLGHRADVMDLLRAAIAEDPDLVIAHAITGLQLCLLARAELAPGIAQSLARARQALARRGGTPRERSCVAALGAWAEHGDMVASAEALEAALAAAPRDAAAMKLAHAIRFMLGDAAGMRLALDAALPHWGEEVPGFGHVLGCHAFALEETGDPGAAERVGRRAVALAPDDLWGAHAVAHVLEGAGRAREGLEWLAGAADHVQDAAGFARHLLWHAALFHLHLGEADAALALYDARLRDLHGEEFRDVANAASLLWRLEAQGIAVGRARWAELADMAERRIGDHSLAFADLHHVMSLAGARRPAALAAFLEGMRCRALQGGGTQAQVIAQVGLPVARAIAAAAAGDPAQAADLLAALRRDLPRLGGSHAQRDVLERIALTSAVSAGHMAEVLSLLRARAARRAPGAWEDALAFRARTDGGVRAGSSSPVSFAA
jgi:tetratricopeptide (TPR) repeat protein